MDDGPLTSIKHPFVTAGRRVFLKEKLMNFHKLTCLHVNSAFSLCVDRVLLISSTGMQLDE